VLLLFGFDSYCASSVVENLKNLNTSIQVTELQDAKRRWILFVQHQKFSTEIKILSDGGFIAKGPLRGLSVFLQDGILRVVGRLKRSDELFERKYPTLLPANINITNMIFRAFHLQLLHIGPQRLLAMVRSEFRPLRGRGNARKVVHLCKKWFRARPLSLQ